MHLGWRWFRAVVGATALGWLGLMTGCSSDDEVSGPPDIGPCADMSSEDCPAPPSESPQDEVPPPVDDGTPDDEPDEQDDEEEPPPGPPPPPPGPGSTLWLAREGTPQDDLALDAAVDVGGDVLTLALQGLDDLHTRHPSDDRAQLVLTRRSADGETRWKKSFEVRAPETPVEARVWVSARIASDPAGGIFLAGNAQGLVDLESQDVGDGAFVARLDANGNLLWASRPSGTGLTVVDLAVDGQGRVRVAFNSPGTADFGGDTRGSGALVVTYAQDGRAASALRIGRPEGEEDLVELTALAVDGRGQLAVGGRYVGTVRFGNRIVDSTRDGSPFLALYEEDGALTWARALSHAQGTVRDVGVDGQGTVVATGPYLGTVDWAGVKHPGHPYRSSPFLIAAGADGTELWGRNLGDGLQASTLAVEPSGELVLGGFTYNRIENGAATSDGLGSAQPVALRYGADGGARTTRIFLSDPPVPRGELYGLEAIPTVAVLPDGDALLFGHTDRESDFGTGRREAARGDVFLLRLKR